MTSTSISLLKPPDHTLVGEMHEETESKNLVWELPLMGAQLLQEPDLMDLCQSSFCWDFMQPRGLILRAGPGTGWGL